MANDREKRTLRHQAGVGPDPRQTRHLVPLKEVKDFKIASGEPDIRGWEIYTSAGRHIGEVEDLLVDPSRNTVVMIDIDLKGTDRHSLAPIRAAWVDREHKRVVLDASEIPEEDLPSLSRTGTLTDEEVRRFGESYARTYGDRGWDEDDEWRYRRADEELRVARQRDRDAESRDISPAELDARARAESDVVVERRALRDVPPDDYGASSREIRYGAQRERGDAQPLIVEETVVRRRVVDPSELPPEERDRLAAERRRDEGADRRP